MSARDNILARLRQNTRETYDMPDLKELQPTVYDDPVAEFKLKTTTTAGAQLIPPRAEPRRPAFAPQRRRGTGRCTF